MDARIEATGLRLPVVFVTNIVGYRDAWSLKVKPQDSQSSSDEQPFSQSKLAEMNSN